jgi:hypothetical protein
VTVHGEDLRRLLDSALPDPALVRLGGRVVVVPIDDLDTDQYRGALLVMSRDELLNRTGSADLSDAELARIAATYCVTADDVDA